MSDRLLLKNTISMKIKATPTSLSKIFKSWNANASCFYWGEDEGSQKLPIWDHSFSKFANFSEKLTFLSPLYAHVSKKWGKTC